MTKYMAAVPLLVAAMLAQNAPSTNKGRHLDITAISREANGAVVSIVMSDKGGHPIAQGSGFLISKDGHVVTNYHVIKSGSSAVVKLPDGSFFNVDGVLAFDKKRDIAVIKAHGNNFKTVALGNSDRLQVGDEVVAIGSPLSLESTVSNGIVSGIRSEGEDAFGPVNPLLQITVPISHGSSGGPLFNMFGQVVGITSAALVGGENLNFAVPINDVKTMLMTNIPEVRPLPDEAEEAEGADHPKVGYPTAPKGGDPDYQTTLRFMNDMLGKNKYLAYTDDCRVSFRWLDDRQRQTLAIPDGHERDARGVHFTFSLVPETFRTPADGDGFVPLGALEPSKIQSCPALTRDQMERAGKNHGDVRPSDVENGDVIVEFSSTNPWFIGILDFASKENAGRFVTAMRHAVTLCGGKEAPFAPAPTGH